MNIFDKGIPLEIRFREFCDGFSDFTKREKAKRHELEIKLQGVNNRVYAIETQPKQTETKMNYKTLALDLTAIVISFAVLYPFGITPTLPTVAIAIAVAALVRANRSK